MATKREHDGGSDPPRKRVKENYKSVTGKLLSKSALSLDNQLYYLFTFRLDNNKTEQYYGNSQLFKDLDEQQCYEVRLNFVKTKFTDRIEIGHCDKCDAALIDDTARVKQSLTRTDFDSEEIVNVLAKLKCVFKKLGAHSYKMMFEINMQDVSGDVRVQQVECFANAKVLASIAKKHVKDPEDFDKLMDFYFKNTNSLFYVHTVRCQNQIKDQSVYLSWTAGPLTSLEPVTDTENEDYVNLMQNRASNNISRSNKHLKALSVVQLKTEQKTSDNGKDSFSVQFKTVDSMEEDENRWNKCIYYVDNNKDESNKNNVIQKLAMDFDQLSTCLSDNLTKAIIFVTVDNVDVNNMNLLGVVKYDDEDCEYYFM